MRPTARRSSARTSSAKKIESYYFNLRERAEDRAEHYRKIANANEAFRTNEDAIKANEIRLAKAEALGGDTAGPAAALDELRRERAALLKQMDLTEEMLVPQYRCKKCSDTGFDKDGNVCDCYRESVEEASDDKKLENILDAYANIDL